MTDIYEEPANVYLRFNTVYKLAIKKLNGETIKDDIINKRKKIQKFYDDLEDKGY